LERPRRDIEWGGRFNQFGGPEGFSFGEARRHFHAFKSVLTQKLLRLSPTASALAARRRRNAAATPGTNLPLNFFAAKRFREFTAVCFQNVNPFLDDPAEFGIRLRLFVAVAALADERRRAARQAAILVAALHDFQVSRFARHPGIKRRENCLSRMRSVT
jgi:hypothetical protein